MVGGVIVPDESQATSRWPCDRKNQLKTRIPNPARKALITKAEMGDVWAVNVGARANSDLNKKTITQKPTKQCKKNPRISKGPSAIHVIQPQKKAVVIPKKEEVIGFLGYLPLVFVSCLGSRIHIRAWNTGGPWTRSHKGGPC